MSHQSEQQTGREPAQVTIGRVAVPRPRRRPQPSPDQPTDAALVQRIVDQDRDALAMLYDRYSRYIYAICLRVLANTADAEDTMIRVFIELWERPAQFDANRGELATYLMILARSRATDLRRSKARHQQLVHDAADRLAPPTADHATPFEVTWLKERRQQVHQALSELSEPQRDAIELAYLEGLTHREVADRLDTPLGTIKTRIRLGLIQLRHSLRTLTKGDAR